MLFWYEYPPGTILDMEEWWLVPASLGTITELPDHKARFTAGTAAMTGEIRARKTGFTVDPYPVRVVRDFDILGRYLYQDYDNVTGPQTNRAMKYLLTELYYTHPNGQYQFTVPGGTFYFRFDQATETDGSGSWGMYNVSVDQSA